MEINEIIKNYKNLISNDNNYIEGTFNDLSKFDFKGVYILLDNDEVVYIGSSYTRNIKERLNQYILETDTGNSLGKTIAKTIAGSTSFDNSAREKMTDAVKKIKNDLKIYAIKHTDLEYTLINDYSPIYNKKGKTEKS